MAIREIRTLPDPTLRKKCKAVPKVDDDIRSLLADMAETMYASPNGAGLAANQVGMLKRLVEMCIRDRDRTSSFMLRLFISPLHPGEFILGYILPLLPMAAAQILLCFLVAGILGLPLTVNVLWSALILLPASVLFIALGLLCGCLLTDKQVGGICGALLTNITAWLSGTWFDLNLVGGVFSGVANALPFVHAVEAGLAALHGNLAGVFPHLWWVLGYGVAFLGLAVWVFTRRMNGDQK